MDANYRVALILLFGSSNIKQDFPEALRLFQLSIDKRELSDQSNDNEANAYYYMGRIYYHGLGVEKDLEKSFQLFKLSAGQGQSEAQSQLGQMYWAQQDHDLALALFEKAANQGNPIAQIKLAVYYFEGSISTPDPKKAAFWLMKAVNNSKNIVQINRQGSSCQDIKDSPNYIGDLHWMQISDSQRCSQAQYEMGLCHLYGRGAEKNPKQAIDWLEKAINNNGNPAALYTLGLMHMKGLGIEVNSNTAFEYSMKSAQQGYPKGQTQLGLCYLNGIGTTKDFKQAKEYFEKALHNNSNPIAQYYIGCLYYKGQGVKVDHELAFGCYLKSAFKNFPDAQTAVGECYMNGLGTKKDYKKSLFWLKNSVSINANASAQSSMGKIYLHGLGVDKDLEFAFHCFENSAKQCNSNGQYMLGKCHEEGYGTLQNYEKAMSCYQDAHKNDKNPQAQYRIGYLYSQGHGVPRSKDLANIWFQQSADQGFVKAQQELAKQEVHGSEKSAGPDKKETHSNLQIIKRNETSKITPLLSSQDKPLILEDVIKNIGNLTIDPSKKVDLDKNSQMSGTSDFSATASPKESNRDL